MYCVLLTAYSFYQFYVASYTARMRIRSVLNKYKRFLFLSSVAMLIIVLTNVCYTVIKKQSQDDEAMNDLELLYETLKIKFPSVSLDNQVVGQQRIGSLQAVLAEKQPWDATHSPGTNITSSIEEHSPVAYKETAPNTFPTTSLASHKNRPLSVDTIDHKVKGYNFPVIQAEVQGTARNDDRSDDDSNNVSVSPSVIVLRKSTDNSKEQVLLESQLVPSRNVLNTTSLGRQRRNGRQGGYALAESFWEQQTSGSRNLQNFQCWAGLLGLRVVEPFVINSVPQTPLNPNANYYQHQLRFGDFFDLQSWNKQSKSLHHAELASWEEFLDHAPRDVIIVYMAYRGRGKTIPANSSIATPRTEKYKVGCANMALMSKQSAFLHKYNFRMSKQVCFNFRYREILLSIDEFNTHIFKDHSPQNVTVIFLMWRGIRDGRIAIRKCPCQMHVSKTDIHSQIALGSKVTDMTERYKKKYLNDTSYIGIMARIEKSKLTFRRKGIVTYCLNKIIEHVTALRTSSGLDKVFLSIDIGKFGSQSFHRTGDSTDLNKEFQKFFGTLYSNSMTVQQWSNTFTDVASTYEPGFIALLQKSIATQAKCIILIGGGSFQQHGLHLYQKRNPKKEDQCVDTIKECTASS